MEIQKKLNHEKGTSKNIGRVRNLKEVKES